MTPLEELPEEMPTEAPQTDCESVKKEWDAASKTGRVSAELMQKALECKLVPEDKVKGMPTGEQSMPPAPTREDNPLAGEDKELGMAELVMADDDWYDPVAGLSPGGGSLTEEFDTWADQNLQGTQDNILPVEYVEDANGNWVSTAPDAGTGGGFDPFNDSFVGRGTPYTPTPENRQPTSGTYEKDGNIYTFNPTGYTVQTKDGAKYQITYYDKDGKPTSADKAVSTGSRDLGGLGTNPDAVDSSRITNMINPNYFSGQAPQKPDDMGYMEWYYRYGNGMYQNAFNPESFYFNPNDKGNAGQTSSPYSRIGNRGNMRPEIVQSNKPFYDERGINKYTNLDELKLKQRTMNMAEVAMPQGQETPMGASVDQTQGQPQEIDEQVQEQLKEAIMEAGFNVVDIGMSPEGKILITVGQFEDSYIENAQLVIELGQEDEVRAILERMQRDAKDQNIQRMAERMTNRDYIEDTAKQAFNSAYNRTPPGEAMRRETPSANYFADQISRVMAAPMRTANQISRVMAAPMRTARDFGQGVNTWANNTTIADAARWAALGIPETIRGGMDWYARDTQNQAKQYNQGRGNDYQNPGMNRQFDYYATPKYELDGRMQYTNPNFNPSGAWRNSMQPTPSVEASPNNWSNYMFNTNPTAQQPFSNDRNTNTPPRFEAPYDDANSQYFEVDFELAEPMKCGKRFKAIAVTPGMYKAKDGTLVELSSEQLQNIAGLFRNKPLVLVDHDLARPESTHEGRNVGYIEDSWYDGDYDAVIYKGALTEDLDLAMIAGSSIKLSHGKTPMGRHIALIPKCIPGRACYAPQDPNAVILENAQKIGEDKMNINPQQAAALKKELEHINKQKESMIDGIIKSEIEAGQLKSNIFDRTRELWKSDVGVLLEMASAKTETKDIPSTKSKDEGKKELSLAKKIEKGEIDPEDALVFLIENDPFFKA